MKHQYPPLPRHVDLAKLPIGTDDDEFVQQLIDEDRGRANVFGRQRVSVDRTRLLKAQMTLQTREAEGMAADGVDGVDECLQANVAVEVVVDVFRVIVEMRPVLLVELTTKPAENIFTDVRRSGGGSGCGKVLMGKGWVEGCVSAGVSVWKR